MNSHSIVFRRCKNESQPVSELFKAVILLAVILLTGCRPGGDPYGTWEIYKGDETGSSYSSLKQINKENVDRLEVAWTYRTGDLDRERHPRTGIETNPIVVDDRLYGLSAFLKVFALDAATGKELWSFDPFEGQKSGRQLRSVTYWEEGDEKRILFTAGSRLFALNAVTGAPVNGFGDGGTVNLNVGLRRDPDSISVHATSPGIVYRDLLILGSVLSPADDAPPGDIRAYDIRTGEIAWTFHTIPLPGEPGAETWHVSDASLRKQAGANSWAGMALDRDRGIVYAPTASPNYDFYGGNRPGKNLYSNTLLALDAATGERIWHYQIIHHGIWDLDLTAPPNLLTVERDGERVDAVAQLTKHGFVFLFDRTTGEPLFPVEERPVPASTLESEEAWPTQPFPTLPAPYARQHLTPDQVTDLSPQARDTVLARMSRYRNEGLFTPPGPRGTIVLPGTRGAARWGGAAHDPESGVLYINATELPQISTVRRVGGDVSAAQTRLEKGRALYVQHCATCHGMRREGRPPDYPELRTIAERSTRPQVLSFIEEGGSMMPAFPALSGEEAGAMVDYLFEQAGRAGGDAEPDDGTGSGRFRDVTAHKLLQDHEGYPGIKPPWGTLNAIDLNTGQYRWKVPLGAYSELLERGIPPTGMPSMGGPVATAGGLLFIGGTEDKKFRAFDRENGELLWETELPAAGFATPATYMSGGRQYVVIAAGGGRGTEPGDYYVAFALPEEE